MRQSNSSRRRIDALTLYYLASELKRYHVPLIPRVCEGLIFLVFGSSIPISAQIGRGGACEHRGQGIVIHREAKIGDNLRIWPQVTIGGRGGGAQGCPTLGDGVIIGTGAKLLGAISVGDGAYIGANAVVLTDVPAGCTAVGVPAQIRTRSQEKTWQ
jgi:serine O-acetyltransferase